MEDIGYPCWHPSGVQSLSRSYPGGIARYRGLNHRLMALNPPGSLLIVVPKDLHPFQTGQMLHLTITLPSLPAVTGLEKELQS